MTQEIPGYEFGRVAPSPVSLADFQRMKATVLFGDDDVAALKRSHAVLADQTDAILDVWYGFVGSQPHLVATFAGADHAPIGRYLEAVRRRFGQWILDTAQADYDERWLAWQHELGLRHHRTRKNLTDGVEAAALVPFRYLPLLAYPVTATLRPFLAKKGHGADDVEAMHAAWVKSVLLQVTLWSAPYLKAGDF